MELDLDSRYALQFRQEHLKRQIGYRLDLLEGTLYKSPSQKGYHLNRKVDGRVRTRYVRKRLVPLARAMVQNRFRLYQLVSELSEVNWRLLQLPPEEPAEPDQED